MDSKLFYILFNFAHPYNRVSAKFRDNFVSDEKIIMVKTLKNDLLREFEYGNHYTIRYRSSSIEVEFSTEFDKSKPPEPAKGASVREKFFFVLIYLYINFRKKL